MLKRLLATWLFVLALVTPCAAQITEVQFVSQNFDGDGTDVVPYAGAIASTSNALFAHTIGFDNPVVTVTGVSGCGATWSRVDTANPTTYGSSLWKGVSPSTGSCSVTVTSAGSTNVAGAIAILEFSGMGTLTDGTTTTGTCTDADPLDCTDYSATGAGVVFHACVGGNVLYSSYGGGFLMTHSGAGRVTMGYKIMTGAGTAAPTVDVNTAPGFNNEDEIVAVYASTGGGGGSTTKSLTLLGVGGGIR